MVVGAGGLGKALLGYEGFKNNGLSIVASFDVNPLLIGASIAGKPVLSMDEFEQFVSSRNIRIGIIAVPKTVAQEILDRMVSAGIKAVWNFAPASLNAPKGIVLKTEDLSANLAILSGRLYRLGD